ncbi:MAG TPA: hypothetical protein VJ420_04165 [Candidatus Udaeobacter sp.]|nr:hypothetical protein [Candidatus Udaeobacter sp.]
MHLCFVYFIGGLAKCLGNGWWNGTNLWRSLIRAPLKLVSPDILVHFKYALPALGISICLTDVSSFHLDEKDSPRLAGLYFGDARGNRINDGVVPLCARYDCDESGSIRRSPY